MTDVEKLLREQLKEELPGGTFDMFIQFLKDKSSLNYSQDEKVIGKWIDGKDLYQKVYKDIPIIEGNVGFDVSTLNIETCINIDGLIKDGEGFRHFKPNNNPSSIGLFGDSLRYNQDTLFYSKEDEYVNFSGYYLSINLNTRTQDIVYREDLSSITIIIIYTKTGNSL